MLDGRFPERDFYKNLWPVGSWRQLMAGRPISGPYGGAFVAVTHDNKARYTSHKFRNFYNARYVCDRCPACSHVSSLSWANFKNTAGWRRYFLTHDSYLASTPLESQSPWLAMPGFVLCRALFDWMHCCHLGTARDVAGQFLHDLCHWGYVRGSTFEERLQTCWTEFRTFCKDRRIPRSKRRFTLATIGLSKLPVTEYPTMDSRTKASHLKPIIAFLAHRLRETADKPAAGDTFARERAWCAFGLADVMDCFDRGGLSRVKFKCHLIEIKNKEGRGGGQPHLPSCNAQCKPPQLLTD